MKRFIAIAVIVCLPGITGCSDGCGRVPQPVGETTVRLEGAIGLSVRAVIGSGYAYDLDIGFARQDKTGGTYGMWGVYTAVRSGGAGNRPILFDTPQSYPADGSDIRLHGYYPADADTDLSGGKVIFNLDGMTDIMATGCLTANAYAPVRTCLFRHLLTQVGLVCYSDRADQWGEITKIEAVEIHARQELDCGAASPVLADASSGEAIRNMPVQQIAGLPVPQVDEGDGLPDAQGYILLPVSPAGGTGENPLRLEITTTKDGKGNERETVTPASVSVEGGFLPGKRHVVSLFFTVGARIRVSSVGVETWTDYEVGELPI